MITVKESHPFSSNFAHACRENYGKDYMGRISLKSARELCGMYPLPVVGSETVVALRPNGPRLYVANISGAYVLRSAQAKVDQWPELFGVRFVRKPSDNERLAGVARAFAENETISRADFHALMTHEATKARYRDSLQRIKDGRPWTDDADIVQELSGYIQTWGN